MEQLDCVVVGAGVVGLAVARALALQGREVLVLEAAKAFGTGTSSRNSEVIHAGIYYAPGSLKARLCVQGRALLYDYCQARGISHRRCGKLLVATDPAQVAQLQGIADQARRNGVTDLVLLSAAEARQLEPQMRLAKVDTEAEPNLGARLNIRSIPTLALFVGGREVARQAGAMGAADIVRWARSHGV